MRHNNIGEKYNKIARWWHNHHQDSAYGVRQLERAISYCKNHRSALDVGCGSGGRMVEKLESNGFYVTGVDVSTEMIAIAKSNHARAQFVVADICSWDTTQKFDLIVAWDSIFHIPFNMHSIVVSKLCGMLHKDGILTYTFGDGYGEHESDWHNDKFYYSTIGINGNLKVILENNCQCLHLELDQYPEKHVYLIAKKLK